MPNIHRNGDFKLPLEDLEPLRRTWLARMEFGEERCGIATPPRKFERVSRQREFDINFE